MLGRVLAIALLASAVAAATAAGAPSTAKNLRYHVAGSAWELGASADCPDGSVRYGIVNGGGDGVGTATICVLFSSRRAGNSGSVVVTERVLETDAFARGWLKTRSTYVYRTPARSRTATVSVNGTVAGGTRRYAGARGTVTGAGSRRGHSIDVALTVRLR
jgi:hypothetical protein